MGDDDDDAAAWATATRGTVLACHSTLTAMVSQYSASSAACLLNCSMSRASYQYAVASKYCHDDELVLVVLVLGVLFHASNVSIGTRRTVVAKWTPRPGALWVVVTRHDFNGSAAGVAGCGNTTGVGHALCGGGGPASLAGFVVRVSSFLVSSSSLLLSESFFFLRRTTFFTTRRTIIFFVLRAGAASFASSEGDEAPLLHLFSLLMMGVFVVVEHPASWLFLWLLLLLLLLLVVVLVGVDSTNTKG